MKLIKDATRTTPRVCFDPSEGVYSLVGKCYPENSRAFFAIIEEWLEGWSESKAIELFIDIDYLSSASTLYLMKIINKMSKQIVSEFSVLWQYEEGDEETLKTGTSLEEACKVRFTYKCIEED